MMNGIRGLRNFVLATSILVGGSLANAQTIQNYVIPMKMGGLQVAPSGQFGGAMVPGLIQMPQQIGGMVFPGPINPNAVNLGASGMTAIAMPPAQDGSDTSRNTTRGMFSGAVSGRMTITAARSSEGKSQPIPMDGFLSYCGDQDGCQLRMAKQVNGDVGYAAMVGALVHINPTNGNWVSGTTVGKDTSGGPQNVLALAPCFLSDGEFVGLADVNAEKDDKVGFGLVSTPANTADCSLTIID